MAFASHDTAEQIRRRDQAPDAAAMYGCLVRCAEKHLILSLDKQVAPILGSLLRRRLAEWGRTVSDV